MKTKLIFIIIVLALLSFSCNKTTDNQKPFPETGICNTENPLEELEWLKEIKTIIEMREIYVGAQIIAYKYYDEDVFWIDECYGCPDNLIKIYNCSGEVICEFGGISGLNTCPDFFENATDSTMLLNYVQH
ncbi:MAG: hypothetical protein K8S16_17450 [Bacteroidales bacterium]|nr:hypothetical protein [Bacteroidales bacterium]